MAEGSEVSAPGWPRYVPVADHALLVSFGDAISDPTSAAVLGLDRALAQSPPEGLLECIPALVNLLIEFDPLVTDHVRIQEAVERLRRLPSPDASTVATREVEVCYEGDFAPDIAAVAQASGLTVDEVIHHHLHGTYQVRMYGFAPGYAYMAGVPTEIHVPRKAAAVRDIAAGSVLIAGTQCLVTTLKMPTGWSIIGRSPTAILTRDERATTPVLFDVGDRVLFKRISLPQYEARRALTMP
ncbi:allophanate hydrolase subunit 1 [Variovorax sp. KK3]|uniref:5-oxoprolinase subunit B family protein n=1 Tax=Variovorax sp. KK3 TaxID=1855728 RepID=UPI00097C9299|nr:allophanate hydrolase subunit 1 [Variovorax sp. KK3]